MKIQIDTKAKIIRIDETVKFDELIKVLNKLLPKEWKSYSLETNSFITWYNPIQWTYVNPAPLLPYVPFNDPPYKVTCGMTQPVNSSVYSIECVIN
jgi:hypothetical protein